MRSLVDILNKGRSFAVRRRGSGALAAHSRVGHVCCGLGNNFIHKPNARDGPYRFSVHGASALPARCRRRVISNGSHNARGLDRGRAAGVLRRRRHARFRERRARRGRRGAALSRVGVRCVRTRARRGARACVPLAARIEPVRHPVRWLLASPKLRRRRASIHENFLFNAAAGRISRRTTS
ncbi:hypothetical protein EVAR_74737_1 [Eumeta japonica]|uniref:Uncharacterized protein n=1 Tax=Eumeta variegata TaxID=151549 RepID=A0A4C1SRW3_EUMVA|nr:hypothetical protein EVAR_74737_1 [Eumeta japonica]